MKAGREPKERAVGRVQGSKERTTRASTTTVNERAAAGRVLASKEPGSKEERAAGHEDALFTEVPRLVGQPGSVVLGMRAFTEWARLASMLTRGREQIETAETALRHLAERFAAEDDEARGESYADDMQAILERLDQGIAAEHLAMDKLLERMVSRTPR